MNWFLTIFRGTSPTARESNKKLQVGVRVRTKLGVGVVTQGAIYVKYEEGTRRPFKGPHQPKNLTFAHNLGKFEVLED